MEYKDKLRAARLKMFMSQEDFAKVIGVSFASVNRWETGKFMPTIKAQKAIHELCKKNDIKFED